VPLITNGSLPGQADEEDQGKPASPEHGKLSLNGGSSKK